MTVDSNSIERSYQLSQQHVEDAVSPHDLAGVLAKAGTRYVMIGGHALGYAYASTALALKGASERSASIWSETTRLSLAGSSNATR
jgi:hypothetical protein